MNVNEVIDELKSLATAEHFAILEHFGINDTKALGIKVPNLRKLAKKIGANHQLALELWETEIHEARLLATMIEDSNIITEYQFDAWVNDFDSWDMCDVSCDLLARTPFALNKIDEYSNHSKEFVKRTAFVLMCEHAVHHKYLSNNHFDHYFELIEREAWDERNFVRKAVNWALRQIGKRNEVLRLRAIECGERILNQEFKSSKWIAIDALRELRSENIIMRLNKKGAPKN
jgi:3-methyladenine DNA glycosylase AlkD